MFRGMDLRRRVGSLFAVLSVVAALAGVPLLAAAPSAVAAAAPVSYQAPGTPSPSVAGATTPFTTYEAPEATLGGGATVVSLTSAPTSEYDSPQGEADGHAYVQLTGPGQSVQWTNNTGQPINFINVRASIPDSSAGGGLTATLDLYVNGTFRQALTMNSIQSWQYEGNNNYNGSDQNPADGDPRDFWDEFHAFVTGAAIPPGATFSLQKDSTNTASFYWINSIDLWDAPAPAAQPANSISITSCGAVADNTPTNGTAAPGAVDSTVDIQNCINQAASAGEIVWIPQGTFYLVGTSSLVAQNVTIEGAGYWYSEVYRDVPLPNNTPLGAAFQCYSCQLENFHIDSDAMSRAEVDGGGGAEDTTGNNWLISGMWVQHVESSLWASGSNGTVQNNLFTVIFADGCNLNNVSLTGTSGSNLTATNNFIRGTGDDGMAINSVAYNGSQTYTAMSDITMSHNTVIAPWGGKGIGIYGGSGHLVEDNFISDTARYIGLGVGRFGVNGSDMLGATVTGNVIVRSGGNAYFQGQPALQIGNGGDGQNVGTVTDATVTGNTILNSVYDSIGFSTSTSTNLSGNTITSPWRNGIVISPPYYPAPTGNASITGNTVTGVGSGFSAYSNDSSGFTATLSNNSWQGGTAPEGPYGGTPAAVPGVVQAENYDTGGQGVAYNVTSTNGTGNGYRSDGIDLETTSDTGGGYDLGWTSGGQWFRYTVNAASAGTYTVSFRVAAPSAVTDALHLASASGANLSGNVSLPATGGWQNWTTVTATVALAAGQQTLTVDEDNGGWNLNYLSFAVGGGGTSSPLTASPSALSFGSVTVGSTSAASTVTVSNPGTTAASVSSVGVSGPFGESNSCGGSIAAGGSCTVSVSFAPTAAGAASGTLSVASSAPGSPLTVALSGTGAAAAGTDLALNQPATASGYTQTYVPSNAVDGNTSSYWESTDNAFPQWFQVDLGSSVAVGRIVLDLPPSSAWGTRTQTIAIQGSTDGATYSTLAASAGYTFNPATGNTVTVTFAAATVRYVKLTFTANTGWPAGQLSELQVYSS
jgi:F5/8 type C domain/Carbohydrate binding module (family 6)/Abnormal spindle-like microcephaly-assoc'd, ASPM-SPD-2-Hydin